MANRDSCLAQCLFPWISPRARRLPRPRRSYGIKHRLCLGPQRQKDDKSTAPCAELLIGPTGKASTNHSATPQWTGAGRDSETTDAARKRSSVGVTGPRQTVYTTTGCRRKAPPYCRC